MALQKVEGKRKTRDDFDYESPQKSKLTSHKQSMLYMNKDKDDQTSMKSEDDSPFKLVSVSPTKKKLVSNTFLADQKEESEEDR